MSGGATPGEIRARAPQTVAYGAGALDRLGELIDAADARRAFVIASASVGAAWRDAVAERLGARCAGIHSGATAHAPTATIAEAAGQARQAGTDAIVSLGGGGAIDIAKCVALMLAEGLDDPADLVRRFDPGRAAKDAAPRSPVPVHVAVPTTASAAEVTHLAGLTDKGGGGKCVIADDRILPAAVILDPRLAADTPAELWRSSAVRALDHAIEGLCGRAANPYTDALALHALRLLVEHLPACGVAEDVAARGQVQLAAWLGGAAALDAGTGLSHGLGYVLGGHYGIPHGICSCVTLPAVMEWNLAETEAAQGRIARTAGWAEGEISDDAAAWGCADRARGFIAGLGLPVRLRDLGAVAEDDLGEIAALALDLPHTRANPRVTDTAADMGELVRRLW